MTLDYTLGAVVVAVLFVYCTASAPMRQNWGGELGRVLVSSQ